ncbi:MAG: motility protein A [Phycisphaerae bacterium]
MDLGTLIGLLAAFGMLFYSLFSGSDGDIAGTFLDIPSLVLVMGGATFVTLASCRLERMLAFAKITKKAFFNRSAKPTDLIRQVVQLADVARREGILSLQNTIAEIKDPFLSNGLQMVVDGTDADTVKQVLDMEFEAIEERHNEGKSVPDQIGKFAPAFGMIGTLIGLVVMLKNMDDVSKIGPGMAIALLTTMYGAILANLFAIPITDKLVAKHNEEMLYLEIARAGILGLQAGDNPRMLEMKLAVFLSPKQRSQLAAAEKG